MSVLLEICVDSLESARAAQEGGADRLEVCGCLSNGGTTPSYGLLKRCKTDLHLPVMMMIRPHDGGFVYREDDIETMIADINLAHSLDLQGIVFGALTEDGKVHVEHCKRLLAEAGTLETTFHRAFDITEDPLQAFDQILELGFNRLLTSGQAADAEAGIPLIRRLHQLAGDRIIVQPGSGVTKNNARQIVEETGVSELHSSASIVASQSHHERAIEFGSERRVTTAPNVRAIKQALS